MVILLLVMTEDELVPCEDVGLDVVDLVLMIMAGVVVIISLVSSVVVTIAFNGCTIKISVTMILTVDDSTCYV